MGTTLRFESQKAAGRRPPIPGPRGTVLSFRVPDARLPRAERVKRLARAGLAWIGLWALLLAGSTIAAFVTDASSKSDSRAPQGRPAASAGHAR